MFVSSNSPISLTYNLELNLLPINSNDSITNHFQECWDRDTTTLKTEYKNSNFNVDNVMLDNIIPIQLNMKLDFNTVKWLSGRKVYILLVVEIFYA